MLSAMNNSQIQSFFTFACSFDFVFAVVVVFLDVVVVRMDVIDVVVVVFVVVLAVVFVAVVRMHS